MSKTRVALDGYESDTDFPFTISTKPKKANKGGLSIENQGVPLRRTREVSLGYKSTSLKIDANYTYVVALTRSIYDEKSNQAIVDDYQAIAPSTNPNRHALLLGINKQVQLSDSDTELNEEVRNTRKQRKKKNKDTSIINTHDMPVHIQFSCWQANWITRDTHEPVSIAAVREAYQEIKKENPERAIHLKRYEKRRSYYPYGAMRSRLFNTDESKAFLDKMANRIPVIAPMLPRLYVLIQDADYCELDTAPLFYSPLIKQAKSLPNNASYQVTKATYNELTMFSDANNTLLDRYDQVIDNHYSKYRRYPRFCGGAHVYSIDENIDYLKTHPAWKKLNLTHCKYWTRFGSEMGNAMKHLIGQYNPYSLYFHEPNTLMLWQGKDRDINFGDKSEMDEYYRRELVASAADAKPEAKFHAGLVVATSQRRGAATPFTVKFFGKYEENRFTKWSDADMRSLQNMTQEIFTSNAWANAVCTAFAKHKSTLEPNAQIKPLLRKWRLYGKDARSVIARLYNLFDPHFLAYRYQLYKEKKGKTSWDNFCQGDHADFLRNRIGRKITNIAYDNMHLESILKKTRYQALIPSDTDVALTEIKSLLIFIYNSSAAEKIMSLARETGELRRSMFHGVLIGESATTPHLVR